MNLVSFSDDTFFESGFGDGNMFVNKVLDLRKDGDQHKFHYRC